MNASDVEALLSEFFAAAEEPDFFLEIDHMVTEPESQVHNVRSFSDAMLMTNDNGVVVKFKDGSEFQITIVQTVPARESDEDDEDDED